MLPVLLTDTVTPDLERAVHYALLWGLEGVELRSVGSAADRVPFVNEAALKRRLTEHELPVVSIVPGMFEGPVSERAAWLNELAAFEETLQFCTRVGCPRIVVSAFATEAATDVPETAAGALQRAGRVAARYGVEVAVLNEAGMAHATGAALARLLDAVDHTSVRAAWHPAAAQAAGEDPAAGLAALDRRVTLVRCSDGRRHGDDWLSTPLGEGTVDWPAQVRLLYSLGFDGPLSLEVTQEPRARQGLRDASRLIQWIREARKGS